MLAPVGLRQCPVAPADLARVHRNEAGNRFKQRRLAGAVRSDQAERFPGIHRKGNLGKRALIAILFAERRYPDLLKQVADFLLHAVGTAKRSLVKNTWSSLRVCWQVSWISCFACMRTILTLGNRSS